MITYMITPVPKPRMTQRDKWARRPPVLRYRAFCDEVRLHGMALPEGGARIVFMLPMPASWSAKKRASMAGQPHQQKPDTDNLIKAVQDAILDDDCRIYDISGCKFWAVSGSITVIDGPAYTLPAPLYDHARHGR
jgi:Holliday junction resolvase RusA-like endonuclease